MAVDLQEAAEPSLEFREPFHLAGLHERPTVALHQATAKRVVVPHHTGQPVQVAVDESCFRIAEARQPVVNGWGVRGTHHVRHHLEEETVQEPLGDGDGDVGEEVLPPHSVDLQYVGP